MFRRGALLGATILMSGFPLQAQSVRSGIDLIGEAEVTSNPYLDEESTELVGAGTVEVRPWVVGETDTGRVEIEGFARGRAFTGRYDFEDTFGGALRASHRASERTNYFGQANVVSTSARSNFSRFNRPSFGFDFDPLTPGTPPLPETPGIVPPTAGPAPLPGAAIVPPIDDITIVGLRGRSTTLSISAGMNRVLDTVSSLNASVGYNRLFASDDAISGYDSGTINLGYSRQLSSRTSAGLSLNVGQARYENDLPETTTYGASANVQHRFDDTWSLNASVGISNSRSEASGIFPAINDTALVGNIGICRARPQSRLCAAYSRSQQPSTLGQVRTSDSLDLTFSQRLSARDRLDLYGNYARSGGTSDVPSQFDNVEIASAGGSYSRTFSDRIEGFAFARASRSWGGLLSEDPSLSFGVGVRARLGDRR